jgi:hypothetical protein
MMSQALCILAFGSILALAALAAPSASFHPPAASISLLITSPSDIQYWLRIASDAAAANQQLIFKRCRREKQHRFCFRSQKRNSARSYTARRLDANVYQFEELALKAIAIGSHDLAVELLINSLAVDEQQEETW